MCLGVPAKVIEIQEMDGMKIAIVEVGGARLEAMLTIDEDVKVGDYVIVHAGIVISKIHEDEVETVLKLWDEIRKELGMDYGKGV